MGAEESKQGSAVSYDLNEESKGVLELPEELHHGPIHSLAVLDNHHLLSAGTDTVLYSYIWKSACHCEYAKLLDLL